MSGTTRWEYRAVCLRSELIVRHEGPGGDEWVAGALNKLGAEGWEAFSGPLEGWFFLKRPRAEA